MQTESIKVLDLEFSLWITADEINQKIAEVAREVESFYSGKELVVLGVLNGAVFFTIDLLRNIKLSYRLDFVQAASYKGTQSTGKVSVTPIKERLENVHVLIVEDVVDTGKTVSVIKSVIEAHNPVSIRVASLFYKPDADRTNTPPDFIGFSIPNKFILGFGLDYNSYGRELKDVYQVVDAE